MAHLRLAAAVLAVAFGLSACDSGEVSDVTYEQVRNKAGDAAAFAGYFDGIKGKTVAWHGAVVEAQKVFEDDYMEAGVLQVDLDGEGNGQADATLGIPVSRIADFAPGQAVAFTAVLREYALREGHLTLKLETKELK